MTSYIGFLRGINVGGKNKIKMADLRAMLEEMNLMNVKTYIQSGNLLFESDQTEEDLSQQIEEQIKKTFDLTVPVILRTAKEVEEIRDCCPFSKEQLSKAEASSAGESLYVALLSEYPSEEAIKTLSSFTFEKEDFHVHGRDVYLLFYDSIRNAKITTKLNKVDSKATVRNWKTINKLLDMST
ncbi:DUF1697 domain-containing protein [Pseudalkalibacillus hwajinpoensis]|uniref:DUF1697 domain-containing protein n=1 Tax=Guptibacillus hwajinpoensis TaxID=208199 RepID=A0A4U1MIM4_9BACL|nr:DUF1697 domain-containing protein [Pseudalkalibacillus hwajinpoensis]TKD70637.1 DUF1697 domain-containing protein [Pseudalkalibacillus hwajinpoensis]